MYKRLVSRREVRSVPEMAAANIADHPVTRGRQDFGGMRYPD